MDALELPRNASADRRQQAFGRVNSTWSMMNPTWPETISLWPCRNATRKWPENGPRERPICICLLANMSDTTEGIYRSIDRPIAQ